MICSPFSGLLPALSSVHNSNYKSHFRKILVWIKADQSRIKAARESFPSSKSSSSRTKELESSEKSCQWMFTGHWYFQNRYGALPDREIEPDDKLEEMWGKMGAVIRSAFLTMLHVTPEYIVVVSNPADIIVDEDESEIILQLRGYIAAKRTS